MPTYEYKCFKSGHLFDMIQRFSDEPGATCPECGSESARQFSTPSIIYKGSGFYTTDYARNGSSNGKSAGSGSPASSSSSDSKSESNGSSASKTESKSTSDSSAGNGSKSGSQSQGSKTSS